MPVTSGISLQITSLGGLGWMCVSSVTLLMHCFLDAGIPYEQDTPEHRAWCCGGVTKTISHPEALADGCVTCRGDDEGWWGGQQTDRLFERDCCSLPGGISIWQGSIQQALLFLSHSQTLGLTEWCFGVGGTRIQQVIWKTSGLLFSQSEVETSIRWRPKRKTNEECWNMDKLDKGADD